MMQERGVSANPPTIVCQVQRYALGIEKMARWYQGHQFGTRRVPEI